MASKVVPAPLAQIASASGSSVYHGQYNGKNTSSTSSSQPLSNNASFSVSASQSPKNNRAAAATATSMIQCGGAISQDSGGGNRNGRLSSAASNELTALLGKKVSLRLSITPAIPHPCL